MRKAVKKILKTIPKRPLARVRLVVLMDRRIYDKAKQLGIDIHALCRLRISESVVMLEQQKQGGADDDTE